MQKNKNEKIIMQEKKISINSKKEKTFMILSYFSLIAITLLGIIYFVTGRSYPIVSSLVLALLMLLSFIRERGNMGTPSYSSKRLILFSVAGIVSIVVAIMNIFF